MFSHKMSQHFTSKFEQIPNYNHFMSTPSKTEYKKGSVFMSQCNATQQLVCLCPGCRPYRASLEESIQDEICDAGFYAQIANEAPTDELRELITSIVGDEYGHARLQASLLGICPPPVSCPPNCPPATGNFEVDVRAAIAGELGAIRRYAELAGCAPNDEVRYLLTSILGDEYAHARIWNAMLLGSSLCPCV
jgi:hypothetical protein